MSKVQPTVDFDNLYAGLVRDVSDLIIEDTGTALNIIEFIEQEVELGIDLTLQQRTVLKAYYNLELTDEEVSVLEYWGAKGRCTWNPNRYNQVLIVDSGRRSGKTSIAALITAYEFYGLCKLRSPQSYYKIATSTPISILVLATTASQGKKTIFKTIVGVVKNTRYFRQLEDAGKLFVGKEEITYEDKLLYIYSGNSQSASQVGGTMKALIMDEVSRFKDTDGESNALELWSNLGIATTTFGKDARRVAISSAWYEGDAIQQLYESTKQDPTALGVWVRSWDMNPIHAARDNPIVASEYARDPVKAAIEFEGVRPMAVDAFFNAEEVKAAFRGTTTIKAQRYEEQDSGFNLVKLRVEHVEPTTDTTVVHIDPAINNDAYAMAYGHNEFDENQRQIVVIDGLLAWEPTYNTEVSISNVQDTIMRINQARPIRKVTADHYNSAETVQRLRAFGITAEVEFFSNRTQLSMYDLLRMLFHEQRIILPNDSPWTPLALSELCKVQLIRGIKIDHPTQGSKDLADAIAAVAWTLAGRLMIDQVSARPSMLFSQQQSLPGQQAQTTQHSFRQSRQKVLGQLQGRQRWLNQR